MATKHYLATPLIDMQLKASSDGWEFTAYASTFGNTDWGGDIIQKGAFRQTLTDRDFRPLLWQHDMREPIGIEKSLKEDGKGLVGTWQLMDTQRGTDAYKLLKAGAVRSMSIGFIPGAFEFVDDGDTRILKTIDLLENSVVSLPMNDKALVQSVKSQHCSACGEHVNVGIAGDLKTDAPLDDLLAQVRGYVIVGVDEAEALYERRSAEQRKLTDSHIEALQALVQELKNSGERAEVILNAVSQPNPPAPAGTESVSAGGAGQSLRLEITRRRLRALGIEVE